MTETIGVVVTTMLAYPETLSRLFSSLAVQTRPPDELIVAVQHEEDADHVASRIRGLTGDLPESVRVRVVVHAERGLSRNRNRGLEEATADILMVADDDIEYEPRAIEVVGRAYADRPDACAITFRVAIPGRSTRPAPVDVVPHSWRSIARVASPEVTFRRRCVERLGVGFDVRFGVGTERWTSGEENIFLRDLLAGTGPAAVLRASDPIARHPRPGSAQRLDPATLYGKGALFGRLYGAAALPLLLAFLLRKARSGSVRVEPATFGAAMRGLAAYRRERSSVRTKGGPR